MTDEIVTIWDAPVVVRKPIKRYRGKRRLVCIVVSNNTLGSFDLTNARLLRDRLSEIVDG